ncbi:hypothetical protein G7Z17_g314 [Cylindrodendrum hubeiense]|uniref:Zn(2)-C6 fungal-type domain-containing protein n=1 Tax=Cylindrodendrum hubeiense TaxID=595255 RepID=A0A9P5LDK0_9HYPO|nr:hypothetical protein G7Z17_g314 [Cylindrodendrum hubeiense]
MLMAREDFRDAATLGGQDAQKQHVTRRTRTRDEAKPQCGRCVDAGVNCQYLTRLSFLDRNSQTLAQDTASGPVGTASQRPKYSAVQLDVYDLSRTFGLLIPQLAMLSPPVLDAVLRVSAVSSGAGLSEMSSNIGSVLLQHASVSPSQVPSFTALQLLVSFVILRIQMFVETVPDTWETTFVGGGPQPSFTMYKFTDKSHRRMWYGTVVLMSRLEIAYCLMHQIAPVWGPDVIREIMVESSKEDDLEGVLNASLRCLFLLGDVMSLCFEVPKDSITPRATAAAGHHVSRLDRWKSLLSELQLWYADRPPDLQSLAELDDHQSIFPVVLFTSGAGMTANALYHTAMYLLLSDKLRPIPPVDGHNQYQTEAASTSPIWHSRRVCGIALTGKEQYAQCWDPCMIAAFFLAARRMTHQAQQKELIECLESVKTAGWRVDKLTHRLCMEWGI